MIFKDLFGYIKYNQKIQVIVDGLLKFKGSAEYLNHDYDDFDIWYFTCYRDYLKFFLEESENEI